MDGGDESKAADGADDVRKEVSPKTTDVSSLVARFIREGGDAQAMSACLVEWLATPAMIAAPEGHAACVAALVEHGADVNKATAVSDTSVHDVRWS